MKTLLTIFVSAFALAVSASTSQHYFFLELQLPEQGAKLEIRQQNVLSDIAEHNGVITSSNVIIDQDEGRFLRVEISYPDHQAAVKSFLFLQQTLVDETPVRSAVRYDLELTDAIGNETIRVYNRTGFAIIKETMMELDSTNETEAENEVLAAYGISKDGPEWTKKSKFGGLVIYEDAKNKISIKAKAARYKLPPPLDKVICMPQRDYRAWVTWTRKF